MPSEILGEAARLNALWVVAAASRPHRHLCARHLRVLYVYLARPDSVLDGISVYRSRMAMGNALAQEVGPTSAHGKANHRRRRHPSAGYLARRRITSRVATLNLAQALGLPYREGFVKNRYVGRTFIIPEQQMRKNSVRRKLNSVRKQERPDRR
ncbi:hypothetical protein EDB87DRAFT_691449 [Lactarius vividus]|nr:hypothetical protein EDB87DRAFT_691449 [Lactarius vividus]